MNKLKLDVEKLAIDSFDVGDEREETGTVRANDSQYPHTHSCRTGVSFCAKCYYSANLCECGSTP